MKSVGIYHKVLRTSAVLVALVLLFDSGLVAPVTKELSDRAFSFLANSATSVTLGVPENELNVISGELSAWERELAAREASLKEREIAERNFGSDTDYSTYILSAVLFLLTVLIIVNYALDWMRVRKIYAG